MFLEKKGVVRACSVTEQKCSDELFDMGSAGLRLSWPQGIFQVWPELKIRANKKTK